MLINKDEMTYAFESKEDYIIRSPGVDSSPDVKLQNLKKVKFTESYSSDNVELISKQELKKIILKEKLL